MIQRYGNLLIGDLTDEREMTEDANGSWIRYEDYEAERSAMCESNLNAVLAEVRADIKELLKSIDEYHETFSVSELESFSKQKLDAGVKMIRLKNKVGEHFS